MTTLTQIFSQNGLIPLPTTVTATINDYLYFFPRFCDLSKREVLKRYVGADSVEKALEIVKRIYEKSRVSKSQWGFTFPVDSEVLAYAMEQVNLNKDSEVCEIACANGENGMLLLYAGAKCLTLNDISIEELDDAKSLLGKHRNIGKRCTIISGSYLNLIKPSLGGKMGLVLCRNLLHFLRDPQPLLKTVHKLLRPDGQAIFVANSIYYLNRQEAGSKDKIVPCNDSGSNSTYRSLQCNYFNEETRDERTGDRVNLCSHWVPCEDDSSLETPPQVLTLYEKSAKTKFIWEKRKHNYKKLDGISQATIKEAMSVNKKGLQMMSKGVVQASITYGRYFNPTNLSCLFRANGFDVISEFFVDERGHLVDFSERFTKARQIGVIVSKK